MFKHTIRQTLESFSLSVLQLHITFQGRGRCVLRVCQNVLVVLGLPSDSWWERWDGLKRVFQPTAHGRPPTMLNPRDPASRRRTTVTLCGSSSCNNTQILQYGPLGKIQTLNVYAYDGKNSENLQLLIKKVPKSKILCSCELSARGLFTFATTKCLTGVDLFTNGWMIPLTRCFGCIGSPKSLRD